MPRPEDHKHPSRPLGAREAEALAETIRTFGTASRLRLLWALTDREMTVEQLAELIGMTPSATSHQLRVLRQMQLVTVRREGRHAHYALHDHHLPDLLAALRLHHEHRHGGATGSDVPAIRSNLG